VLVQKESTHKLNNPATNAELTFDHSEADIILFSAYAILRESGYSGPVIIDSADTDTYVAIAFIAQQLLMSWPGKFEDGTLLCSYTALPDVMLTQASTPSVSSQRITR
jgi:hypothetical protein